ncbi:unnamed protein product [Phyllotreta striolata]|uniref:Serpin domain-containing protein n=1 Tax=Phyllotreta striolata TaxID=444603 RepID=A0A9N9XHG6_PHYSR|nr:unnamed protein product [Phyllotreta striolata]
MWLFIVFLIGADIFVIAENFEDETKDGKLSRKILGQSVVTSVSVVMDIGNGSKTIFTDTVGKPVEKPSSSSELASPINLLNPDRYEFYTFDDSGNLVRRLMSLEEIKGIIATGDSDGLEYDSTVAEAYIPEKRVNDVLSNVQNVLKEEMEIHGTKFDSFPALDTPDVSDSWNMILPAVFGNSGVDITPEKAPLHVTPDTIMVEPTQQQPSTISTVPLTTKEPTTILSTSSTTSPTPPAETTVAEEEVLTESTTKEYVPVSTVALPTEPDTSTMFTIQPINNNSNNSFETKETETTMTTLNSNPTTENNVEITIKSVESSINCSSVKNESDSTTLLPMLDGLNSILHQLLVTPNMNSFDHSKSEYKENVDFIDFTEKTESTMYKDTTNTVTETILTKTTANDIEESTNSTTTEKLVESTTLTFSTQYTTTEINEIDRIDNNLDETDNKTSNEFPVKSTKIENGTEDYNNTTTLQQITTTEYNTPTFTTEGFNNATVKVPLIDPSDSSTETTITSDDNTTTYKDNTSTTPSTTEITIPNDNKKEPNWTLVPTVAPHSEATFGTPASILPPYPEALDPPEMIDLRAEPLNGFGLEESTADLDKDIQQFSQLYNELAFDFWKKTADTVSHARSLVVSPFGAISSLAMIFLGARGSTSAEMNEILKLDDMITFNPHLVLKNVGESVAIAEESGAVTASFVKELFMCRMKGKFLPFYRERVKAFYDGFAEEINFKEVGDIVRRRTNLQVKKHTDGKIAEFLTDTSVVGRPPLLALGVNIFQTDCSSAYSDNRDGEMHFTVLPTIRQRRLVPIPAVLYKYGFLAGYEPSLDATAVSVGNKNHTTSTIFVMPGQQGVQTPGDGLSRLEKSLAESSFKKGAWSRLLRSLIARPGLEVQIPKINHRSVVNATEVLKQMGFVELFKKGQADLVGMNGISNDLYLSDVVQVNQFTTCSEKRTDHHSEIYPNSVRRFRSNEALSGVRHSELPLPLRPRQARKPEVPRLKFDRPFLYFVRHNPTGLILHIGRFNPRLLP